MSAPIPYPLINGFRYDFSSVILTVDGIPFNGVKEITYKNTLKPGIVRGNRAQKIGRTRGTLDSEGSITLYKAEFTRLIEQLALKGAQTMGGAGYMEVSFDISVSYAEFGGPTITDVIIGARLGDHEDTGTEGGEAIATKCMLDIMQINMGTANSSAPISPIGGAAAIFK